MMIISPYTHVTICCLHRRHTGRYLVNGAEPKRGGVKRGKAGPLKRVMGKDRDMPAKVVGSTSAAGCTVHWRAAAGSAEVDSY